MAREQSGPPEPPRPYAPAHHSPEPASMENSPCLLLRRSKARGCAVMNGPRWRQAQRAQAAHKTPPHPPPIPSLARPRARASLSPRPVEQHSRAARAFARHRQGCTHRGPAVAHDDDCAALNCVGPTRAVAARAQRMPLPTRKGRWLYLFAPLFCTRAVSRLFAVSFWPCRRPHE